jgi:hypothetical protein
MREVGRQAARQADRQTDRHRELLRGVVTRQPCDPGADHRHPRMALLPPFIRPCTITSQPLLLRPAAHRPGRRRQGQQQQQQLHDGARHTPHLDCQYAVRPHSAVLCPHAAECRPRSTVCPHPVEEKHCRQSASQPASHHCHHSQPPPQPVSQPPLNSVCTRGRFQHPQSMQLYITISHTIYRPSLPHPAAVLLLLRCGVSPPFSCCGGVSPPSFYCGGVSPPSFCCCGVSPPSFCCCGVSPPSSCCCGVSPPSLATQRNATQRNATQRAVEKWPKYHSRRS